MKTILYLPCVVAAVYAEDALQPLGLQIEVTPVTGGTVRKSMGVEEVDKHCYAVLELLEAVHDRAGADAAAAEIDKHAVEVSFIFNRHSGTLDSCSSRALNIGQMDACEMSMLAVCRKLREQEPPYFDSEALEKSLAGFMWAAFHHFPGEEFAGVQEAAREAREAEFAPSLSGRMKGLQMECAMAYASVMDKESADAAALRLEELEVEKCNLLQQARLIGFEEALSNLMVRPMGTQEMLIINGCRERLMDMDPPCYGSEALREAIIQGSGLLKAE